MVFGIGTLLPFRAQLYGKQKCLCQIVDLSFKGISLTEKIAMNHKNKDLNKKNLQISQPGTT